MRCTKRRGNITWEVHTFMNFHISVNLIFVSALLCFCRVVPGPIFWAVEAHICISNDSVVGESSCHIAMTVIQNQTCKKKERKYSNRVVFSLFSFFAFRYALVLRKNTIKMQMASSSNSLLPLLPFLCDMAIWQK